jgi:hypothetical protein
MLDFSKNEAYSIETIKKQFGVCRFEKEFENCINKFLSKIYPKEYSIWFIESMGRVGMWTEIDRFLNQKAVNNSFKTKYFLDILS